MTWSDGYVSDLNYAHGYYQGLNPLFLRFTCLFSGLEPPRLEGLRYLELGFGQGLSLNIHAAACDGSFWGTDFNASHALSAKELASASVTDLRILDHSFKQLLERTDLPEFDVIGLHGVWSWISQENRDTIVEIIRRHLRPGGIVYVSYNCMPGWAPMLPVRELMTLYKSRAGNLVDAHQLVEDAVKFAQEVLGAQPNYFDANPNVAKSLELLTSGGTRHEYIAHEYLNRDWKIASFADVATALGDAKLTFVASTRLLDNVDKFRLKPDALKVVDKYSDPIVRESIKDYMMNAQFRGDVFVKGQRQLQIAEFHQRWLGERFVLTTHLEKIPAEVRTPAGTVAFKEGLPQTVVELLRSQNWRPKTIEELVESPALQGTTLAELVDAVVLLVGAGLASPAQIPSLAAVERCKRLNRHILERACVDTGIQYLASPITGGGIQVPHLCLLLLNALRANLKSTQELVAHVLYALSTFEGSKRLAERPTASVEDEAARVRSAIEELMPRTIPMLKALVPL